MDNDFKKYYEDGLSLMEQTDFQCRIADDDNSLEESMREAFLKECDKAWEGADDTDVMLARASFSKVASTLGLKNIYRAEQKRHYRKYRLLKWTSGVAVCMVAAFLCFLSWTLLNPEPEPEWVEVSVPYGQTSEILLSDGTRLFLNSGSRVTYPTVFNGPERKIFVEGEILADVAGNPEQPFVAHTENMNIRVLGTTFNLKAYRNSDCVEVFLLEGKIQCDINAENCRNSITMNPGNVVQYDRLTGEMNITNASTNSFKSSKESGAMHFFNLTLNDIAKDLELHFNTEIIIVNEKLSQTQYFALFTNGETLDEILNILNSDKTMKIKKISDKIYIE